MMGLKGEAKLFGEIASYSLGALSGNEKEDVFLVWFHYFAFGAENVLQQIKLSEEARGGFWESERRHCITEHC